MKTITSQVSRRCSLSEAQGAYVDFLRHTFGVVPEKVPTPGKVCRFGGRNKPLWALLFEDAQSGIAGDWRSGGDFHVWHATREPVPPKKPAHMPAQARSELARMRNIYNNLFESQKRQRNQVKLRAMWAQALPVTPETPVARYLMHRLNVTTWPPFFRAMGDNLNGYALRYAPELAYFQDDGQPCGTHPAMLGALTNPHGELVAIHRTWLTPAGRKADVPGPVKKLTPTCGPLAGAGIALFSGPDAWGRIGIAEGIETALAASLGAGLPVCAAYSASNLAAWCWPVGTRRVVIFADHDPAGEKAAQALQARALAAGVQASIQTPSTEGQDWCDVWAQRPAKEVQA